MRKYLSLATIVLVLGMVVGFASCKKEGVYKPKEKISKIYYESSRKEYYNGELSYQYSSQKRLIEKWNWSGKKLIQIEHDYWPYNFLYKGNQLEKIEYGDVEVIFTYNKSLYDKIEIKENGQNDLIITVDQRDGDNITKFTLEAFYENSNLNYLSKRKNKTDDAIAISSIEPILQIILPNNFIDFLSKSIDKKKQKAMVSEKYTIELKYDKNNIIEQKFTDSDGYEETYIFTYDNKKNPYYKSIHGTIEGIGEGTTFIQSENNIKSMYDKESPEDITKYDYEYDGDYPVKRTEKYSYTGDVYSSEYTYIYYYEYK